MLDTSSYTPLFRQLFDVICKRIVEGVYPRGSKLPSQNEFTHEFNVSMITVRQAFRELNEKGFIRSKRGTGTVVLQTPQMRFNYHTQGGLTFDANSKNYQVRSKVIQISPCKHLEASLAFENERTDPVCINRLRFFGDKKVALDFAFLNPRLLSKTNWELSLREETSLYAFMKEHYGYHVVKAEESLFPINPKKNITNILGMEEAVPILFVKRETYIAESPQPIEYCESYIIPEYYGKIVYSVETNKNLR